jgi:hypothetical protein
VPPLQSGTSLKLPVGQFIRYAHELTSFGS